MLKDWKLSYWDQKENQHAHFHHCYLILLAGANRLDKWYKKASK